MRVVELDRVLLVEAGEVPPPLPVDADHVLERAGDEEVLLLQAQPLARQELVVRVEDLGDVLRVDLEVDRAPVVPLVEGVEVEGLRGLRLEQAEEVRGAVAIAEDGDVVGHAPHHTLRDPAHPVAALRVLEALGMAAQRDVEGDLGPRDLPGIAQGQPLVGLLDLPPVADELVEDPELVADAVADGRDGERGQRVHVAGGQAPEAAVAEAGLLLLGQEHVEVVAELGHGLPRLLLHAEVQEVVGQVGPQQELGREVAHGPARSLVVGLAGRHPVAQRGPPHGVGQRQVEVVAGGRLGEAPEGGEERVGEVALHGLDQVPVGHLGPPCAHADRLVSPDAGPQRAGERWE